VAFGAFVQRGAAQGYALVNRAAVANFSGFTHHHAHGMVEKHPLTNDCPWVNFNTGEKPRNVRNKPTQPK
jgi:hypothetical protein